MSNLAPSAYTERRLTSSIDGKSSITPDIASPSRIPRPETRMGFLLKNLAISDATMAPPRMLSTRSGFSPGMYAKLALSNPRNPLTMVFNEPYGTTEPWRRPNEWSRVSRSILVKLRIVPPAPIKVPCSAIGGIPDARNIFFTCRLKPMIASRSGCSEFRKSSLTRSAPRSKVYASLNERC